MRFLHLSDLHIGRRLNGFSLLEDQKHMLEQLLSMSKECDSQQDQIRNLIRKKTGPFGPAFLIKKTVLRIEHGFLFNTYRLKDKQLQSLE